MRTRNLLIAGFLAALFVARGRPSRLRTKEGSACRTDWPLAIANVLPSGQPVIPIFESWYPNPDGTIVFSFGYMNLNSVEVADIPARSGQFHRTEKVRRISAHAISTSPPRSRPASPGISRSSRHGAERLQG